MGKMSYKKRQFGERAPARIPDFIDYYVSDPPVSHTVGRPYIAATLATLRTICFSSVWL